MPCSCKTDTEKDSSNSSCWRKWDIFKWRSVDPSPHHISNLQNKPDPPWKHSRVFGGKKAHTRGHNTYRQWSQKNATPTNLHSQLVFSMLNWWGGNIWGTVQKFDVSSKSVAVWVQNPLLVTFNLFRCPYRIFFRKWATEIPFNCNQKRSKGCKVKLDVS